MRKNEGTATWVMTCETVIHNKSEKLVLRPSLYGAVSTVPPQCKYTTARANGKRSNSITLNNLLFSVFIICKFSVFMVLPF